MKVKLLAEKGIYNWVNKDGESWTFGIVKGEINKLFQDHNLELIKHVDSNELE